MLASYIMRLRTSTYRCRNSGFVLSELPDNVLGDLLHVQFAKRLVWLFHVLHTVEAKSRTAGFDTGLCVHMVCMQHTGAQAIPGAPQKSPQTVLRRVEPHEMRAA